MAVLWLHEDSIFLRETGVHGGKIVVQCQFCIAFEKMHFGCEENFETSKQTESVQKKDSFQNDLKVT